MLAIGASVTVGNYVLPSLLIDFLQRNPGVGANVSIRNTRDMIAAMRAMEADIALVEGLVSDPDLNVSPWRRDELIIVAGSGSSARAPRGQAIATRIRAVDLAGARRRDAQDLRNSHRGALCPHAPAIRSWRQRIDETDGDGWARHWMPFRLRGGRRTAARRIDARPCAMARPIAGAERGDSPPPLRRCGASAAFIRHCEGAGDFPFRPTLTAEI